MLTERFPQNERHNLHGGNDLCIDGGSDSGRRHLHCLAHGRQGGLLLVHDLLKFSNAIFKRLYRDHRSPAAQQKRITAHRLGVSP